MINLEQAAKVASKVNKNFLAIPSCETKNYYVFIPADKNGHIIGNSSSIVVDKNTGEGRLAYFMELLHEEVIKDY